MEKINGPRILLIDIETAPILGYVWGLWENNLSLSQIKSDWYILSYSAKFLGEKKIYYKDQRNVENVENDKELLKEIWKLLDSSDIVITQNGISFDHKKINARFILNGLPPPSSFKKIDTMRIAKKHFGFTSNKLEYMSDKLCSKYKKLSHKKYPGFELWKACISGDKKAWEEMKKYNIHDVLALEELFNKLQPWDNSINLNLYTDTLDTVCSCGSKKFNKNGYAYTSTGRYQRYSCSNCGAEIRGKTNLLSKEKIKSLMK